VAENSGTTPEPPEGLHGEDDHHTAVISLLSGKGGTGKTTIALSIATFLCGCGFKTALIDFDLSTHGATYFLLPNLQRQGKSGILDLLAAKKGKPITVTDLGDVFYTTSTGFEFVASKSLLSARYQNSRRREPQAINDILSVVLERLRDLRYDFVIIDCQAGPEGGSVFAAGVADTVIVVAEPDPVSLGAVENLNYEVLAHLGPGIRKFFLLNKFGFEEARDYERMREYLGYLNHLPPVPFSLEVRTAFSRLMIPLSLKQPTVFVGYIAKLVEALLPPDQRGRVVLFRREHEDLFREDTGGATVASLRQAPRLIYARVSAITYSVGLAVIGLLGGAWYYFRSKFGLESRLSELPPPGGRLPRAAIADPQFVDDVFTAVMIPILSLFLAVVLYLWFRKREVYRGLRVSSEQ
jgi:cellulose biosynthesis protein BcsQ